MHYFGHCYQLFSCLRIKPAEAKKELTFPWLYFVRKKALFFLKKQQRQSPIVEITYQLRPRKDINRELLTGKLI